MASDGYDRYIMWVGVVKNGDKWEQIIVWWSLVGNIVVSQDMGAGEWWKLQEIWGIGVDGEW